MQSSTDVAAYCRVSTLEQKKNGLGMEIQIRDVTAFATAQGLAIDRFYRDEAQSGAAEKRKELERLLRACKQGRIGTLIIPSLDRLSRNVRIAENLFWRFEQLGIRVLIADMPNYNGQDRKDVLIRQIREAIAEENRKDIVERLWKGRLERTRKGKAPGGNAPFGYMRRERNLVPDLREAAVVREAFALVGSGSSSAEVASALNRKGRTRRNGGAWSARDVQGLLARRELYAEGRIRYGDTEGTDKNLIILGKGA